MFKLGQSDDESSSESSSESDSESETENRNEGCTNGNCANDADTQSEVTAHMKNTPHKLLHDRNKLKKFADLIDSTRKVPDSDSPACQIIFHNNKFSRRYRTMIENFITGLLFKDKFDMSQLPEIELEPTRLTCVDINEKLPAAQRTKSMWSSHAIIGCSQFHQYFLIDTLGWPLVNFNPSLTDSWEIPKFEQYFLNPIPFDEEEAVKSKPERPKPCCFNCGGEHMIAECQEVKDFQRIKKNKAEFLDKSSQNQKLSGSRYHKDEVDPRFAAFKPGQISDSLREALGISSKQIPLYVYRMRLLGYPPGWLEDAKKQVSGLVLFDKHGKEVDIAGQSMEDGEVNEDRLQEPQINVDKIVEYPGFTVELDDTMVDEHKDYDFPPIQPHQLKSALVQRQAMIDQMKKRKLEEEEYEKNKKLKVELSSMDLDEEESNSETADEFMSPRPYSSSPVAASGQLKRLRVALPGNPPLPFDTPPGKPPLPEGTPPPTPEEISRRSGRTPLPGEPPLPMYTPPARPPLPQGTPPPTPVMPSPIHRQLSSMSAKSERSDSPTLDDLQKQYQLLQEKLAQDECTDNVELQIVDSIDEDEDDSMTEPQDLPNLGVQLARQGSTTSIQTFGELGTGSQSDSLPNSPVTPKASFSDINTVFKKCNSISKDFGTPIYMRTISKEKLPDASNFGQGIEEHIPYENLPDATGSYSKISKLIDKIRSSIKRKK